jgi:hypothetical protein
MKLGLAKSIVQEGRGANNTITGATQMLSKAGALGGVSSFLDGSQFNGPDLVYIPTDNGDQVRMIDKIVVDVVNDSGIRTVISNYSLQAYRTDAGQPLATAIPYPRISPGGPIDYNETLTIYFSPTYTPFFTNGQCSCTPLTGNCANGYRRVSFIKKRDFRPGTKSQIVNGWVVGTEFNPRGDGGYSITVKLGLSRKNTNADPLTFEKNVPFDLEVGDLIVFGNVDITTQCIPEPCCVKASPRVYQYCSYSQRVSECVYTDEPQRRRHQPTDQLDWVTEASYKMLQTARDIVLRMVNDIMFSQPYYSQGQRLPIPVPDATNPLANTEYSDCEIIPTSTRGVIPTVEEYGRSITHTFVSCNDTCGQYKLERITEVVMDSRQGRNIYNDTSFKLVGAVKVLEQYVASMRRYSDLVPNVYSEAQRVERMRGASFSKNAKSFFGSAFDADSTDIQTFIFGGRAIPTMNDLTLQRLFEDTLWFLSDNAFVTFTVDVDSLERMLIGQNYYLPSTGQRGKLVPTVYTQDLVPTVVNGQMEFKTRQNCGLKYYAFMEYGIHPKPEYLPHLTKISFGARAENPAFDPNLPESLNNLRYIYGSLQDTLNCGCSSAEAQIRDSIQYWSQV